MRLERSFAVVQPRGTNWSPMVSPPNKSVYNELLRLPAHHMHGPGDDLVPTQPTDRIAEFTRVTHIRTGALT
jgi:hypothetical protein